MIEHGFGYSILRSTYLLKGDYTAKAFRAVLSDNGIFPFFSSGLAANLFLIHLEGMCLIATRHSPPSGNDCLLEDLNSPALTFLGYIYIYP